MIEKIKSINLFCDLEDDILNKNIKNGNATQKEYAANHTLHEANEKCSTIDFVVSGDLTAYSLLENGNAMTIFEFPKGSIIGANLLFGETNSYPFNIYSVVNSTVIHIDKSAILDFLKNYNFTLKFIKNLSLNSGVMNKKISVLTEKTLRENILDYLNRLSFEQNSNDIILEITKKQLADLLGVKRPSLFREFKKLKDDGIIDVNNKRITLINTK